MKTTGLFICFILLHCIGSFAQNLSEIGDISKEEAELKQCSFDMEAKVVILLHEAFSNYDRDYQLVTLHHVRIKILKESGIEAANISIPFYRKNNFEKIDKIEGVTVNIGPGGDLVKEKLDRKTIYTTQTNERIGEVAFAFPSVKVGSIIDYKYRSTMKNYSGLDEWRFQEELPVVSSKYMLTLLPNTEFAYRANKRSDRNILITPDPENGRIFFEMADIPGLEDEPYMDARKDYLQKVIFQLSGYKGIDLEKKEYMSSWEALNTELISAPDFGGQLKANVGANELLTRIQILSPEEKMKTIYDYVRSNMKWNNLYSKYSADGIKDAWKKKSGTSGDINLLLVNLLKEAGLDAFPMLVSEHFHGKVNTDYPFIDQFNSVFACVVIHEKNYYLDATDKFCPSHITPFGILNTTAFIVKGKSGELIAIKNDSLLFKEDINCLLEVKDDGSVKGNLFVKSKDYARIDKLERYENGSDKFKNLYFTQDGSPQDITGFEIKNRENDSLALEQEFEFNTKLNSSGEYYFISPNFLSGFKKNPFLSENRFSNINFGYRKKIDFITTIKLSAGYLVDNIPGPVQMTNPDQSILFQRQVIHDKGNNKIVCTISVTFKRSLYTADEYSMLKEIYKKIFDYLKEPVLLRKK